MFSKFSITKNKETAKYLPYNELSYPKLESHKHSLKNKIKNKKLLGITNVPNKQGIHFLLSYYYLYYY